MPLENKSVFEEFVFAFMAGCKPIGGLQALTDVLAPVHEFYRKTTQIVSADSGNIDVELVYKQKAQQII